jgi:3-oxoacyl-[acyl-carrier-protein] synthase I
VALRNISGLGLVTCVGHDVNTSCAAHRARLSRFRGLPELVVFDPETLEEPIFGAPVDGVTDGFVASGRLLRLAQLAVADLIRYAGLPGREDLAFWSSTGVVWCLPDLSYSRFMWPEDEIPEILQVSFGDRLSSGLDLPLASFPAGFVAAGHTSAARILCDVDALVRRTGLQRLIFVGVDSLVDRLALRELVGQHRVKTPEKPAGLSPGEAAAAMLLEADPTSGSTRRAESQIASVACSAVPPAPDGNDFAAARLELAPVIASNVADVVTQALEHAGLTSFRGDLIVDLNGENWKAAVWGQAQVKVAPRIDLARTRVVVPAVSFGEIGAASALAGICLATRSFVRRYSYTEWCLILSISDAGAASAILVRSA